MVNKGPLSLKIMNVLNYQDLYKDEKGGILKQSVSHMHTVFIRYAVHQR